ncbi:MAG: ATP-binding cassette domain-containing protein [Velocimicrobium sp.]
MNANDYRIKIKHQSVEDIISEYPIVEDFLANYRLSNMSRKLSFYEELLKVDDEILEEFGLNRFDMIENLSIFLDTFSQEKSPTQGVSSITIQGGFNKLREAETINLSIHTGEVISIVGPTGSGKSRLLNDIECLAQNDTPTGRSILINEKPMDEIQRFEMDGKLVAQLSQNMNFVMDLSVQEFLEMHAKCRLTKQIGQVVEKCFVCANKLAGERFSKETKVTQLSGGQSRALMIADTAYMSDSPVVLIDEIENAGINRRQAIELLARKDKIIFVSTHDPLLALSADKRIIIKNGGIYKVLETSEEERDNLEMIERFDNAMLRLRESLRAGDTITKELLAL